MPHGTGLILTITASLVAAFAGGFIATRLRLPVIVGYLLAGIAIGPFTPGFTGNVQIASELAEIGVILLMFGVGIHFSLRQLLAVRSLALPGALGQATAATLLGLVVAVSWGWGIGPGLVLGVALSVASTVVLLRALMEADLLNTSHGKVAVGWLIVEDLFTVLVLVILPALAPALGGGTAAAEHGAGGGNVLLAFALAIGKTALFIAIMLFVGARAFPWFLAQVARTGSRELFTLAVLAVALGVAVGAAYLLGISFALGAFVAGMVISESDQSHQAAADALPMRDAFAVLFFVSVGMLFNPATLLASPWKLLEVVAIVIIGKALAGLLIVALLGGPLRTGLVVAAGLAQIGEFSFIVAQLGRELRLLPDEGYQLVLAGALLSISLNPLLFRLVDPVEAWMRRQPRLIAWLERRGRALTPADLEHEALRDHAVVVGYGRVGRLICRLLEQQLVPYVVIEQSQRRVEELRAQGERAYFGDGGNEEILSHVGLHRARVLVVATPDPLATRRAAEYARRVNPHLDIIARTHSEREWEYLRDHVSEVVLGEREAALEMARSTLRRFGVPANEIDTIVTGLRGQAELEGPPPEPGLNSSPRTSQKAHV